jgi:hypothetical protein
MFHEYFYNSNQKWMEKRMRFIFIFQTIVQVDFLCGNIAATSIPVITSAARELVVLVILFYYFKFFLLSLLNNIRK